MKRSPKHSTLDGWPTWPAGLSAQAAPMDISAMALNATAEAAPDASMRTAALAAAAAVAKAAPDSAVLAAALASATHGHGQRRGTTPAQS